MTRSSGKIARLERRTREQFKRIRTEKVLDPKRMNLSDRDAVKRRRT